METTEAGGKKMPLPRLILPHDEAAARPPEDSSPNIDVVETTTLDNQHAVCFMEETDVDEAQVSGCWYQIDSDSLITITP